MSALHPHFCDCDRCLNGYAEHAAAATWRRLRSVRLLPFRHPLEKP
jgi:hypothetical protein